MNIEMVVRRVTRDRSTGALKSLRMYIPKLKKLPLTIERVWYKRVSFWFLIVFIIVLIIVMYKYFV